MKSVILVGLAVLSCSASAQTDPYTTGYYRKDSTYTIEDQGQKSRPAKRDSDQAADTAAPTPTLAMTREVNRESADYFAPENTRVVAAPKKK